MFQSKIFPQSQKFSQACLRCLRVLEPLHRVPMHSWPFAKVAVPEAVSAKPPIHPSTKGDLYHDHVDVGYRKSIARNTLGAGF